MDNNISFSVIIPVHNKFPHIDRCVNSVLNQQYKNFELVVVDDASTDGSYEKLLSYGDQIKLLKRNHPGPGGYLARNMAIKNASNDWISFLDADDSWEPSLLQEIKEVISSNPAAQIITCGWTWVDNDKKQDRNVFKNSFVKKGEITPFSMRDFLMNPDLMWTGAVTMRKDLLEQCGGFPTCPNCKKGGDMDTWIRALMISKYNLYLDKYLSHYYRDTVNRVTDHSHNPTSHFCAYPTLMNAYQISNSKSLKKAIKHFINRNIFLLVIKQIRAGFGIEYALVKKLKISFHAIYYFVRIHIERLRFSTKKKRSTK